MDGGEATVMACSTLVLPSASQVLPKCDNGDAGLQSLHAVSGESSVSFTPLRPLSFPIFRCIFFGFAPSRAGTEPASESPNSGQLRALDSPSVLSIFSVTLSGGPL